MSAPVLELRGIRFGYRAGHAPVLADVDLAVEEGELVLLSGPTGVGKSTLLGVVSGLVPRFSGGVLAGDVLLEGQSVLRRAPRDRAHLVGYVGQDPALGFVTDTVEEELAYGMEQLGLPPATMRRRVEETLDLLGIAGLRARDLRTLSGGQQQRVAIGAVLTMHPRLLVLDEPTSALDPTAAEEVLATLTRLVHDLGVSVLLAEHRLERVVPFADQMCLMTGGGRMRVGAPADLLADSPVAPPIVELGRAAGWSPLPLSVRDARRRARGLADRLGSSPVAIAMAARSADEDSPVPVRHPPSGTQGWSGQGSSGQGWSGQGWSGQGWSDQGSSGQVTAVGPADGLVARDLTVVHGREVAVRSVDLALPAGRVTALMGRNGSGKSSLLWALQGTGARFAGAVRVRRGVQVTDPAAAPARERRALVGLLPQNAADLLYLETVADELAAGDDGQGTCRALLDSFVPGVPDDAHPRDLSEGQRLALALALVLAARPGVVLLDEPTRGLDYAAKHQLAATLRSLAAEGHAVLVASHDVEFVAQAADHALVLAQGEVVSRGPARRVVAESPAFAPQVTKVLGLPWLRVDEVVAALETA